MTIMHPFTVLMTIIHPFTVLMTIMHPFTVVLMARRVTKLLHYIKNKNLNHSLQ